LRWVAEIMNERFILYTLTCGPLVLTLIAWLKLYWERQRRQHALALVALGTVSANAALAAATFLYYELRPPPHFLPPWQDPEVLRLGLLFLFAPVGMILGGIAGVRGAPKWLVAVVEIASVPLLMVGFMAGATV
jgi:hypothetical protein